MDPWFEGQVSCPTILIVYGAAQSIFEARTNNGLGLPVPHMPVVGVSAVALRALRADWSFFG